MCCYRTPLRLLLVLGCAPAWARNAPLDRAARLADVHTVSVLLEAGEVDGGDAEGRTALMLCGVDPQGSAAEVDQACAAISALLLSQEGARVDEADRHGWTALSWASSLGHARTVSVLLQHGADPDWTEGLEGHTPLMLASANAHTQALRPLLHRGADTEARAVKRGFTAAFFAVRNGHHEVWRGTLAALLAGGASANAVAATDESSHMSLLMFAAQLGDLATVKLLVEEGGADLFSTDTNGAPAVSWASSAEVQAYLRTAMVESLTEEHRAWEAREGAIVTGS